MIFTSVVVLIASCSKSESQTPFVFSDSNQPGVMAKFNDTIIQESDLIKGIETDIYEEEYKIYQMKMDRLKQIVSEKLIAADSKSKGLTKEQYFEKNVYESVSEKEIDSFIKDRNLPQDQITKEIRERIKTVIQGDKNAKAVDVWINKKMGSEKINVFFKKPTRPRFDVKIGDSSILGSPDAKVKIVEFSDFQCPHCSRAKVFLDDVKKKYKNDVAIVFKHYPLPFHTQARVASNAGLCAKSLNPDSFWKLYDYMFTNQTKLSEQDLKEQAKKIGLDPAKFNACLDAKTYDQVIQSDINHGNDVGVKSTPTIFINGQIILGAQPVEILSEIIDEELAKK